MKSHSSLLVSKAEWDYALKLLKGKELAPKLKISRKDHPNVLNHSFIAIKGKRRYRLFAVAKHSFLGEGAFGRVKLIEDKNGKQYALKVSREKAADAILPDEIDMLRVNKQLVDHFSQRSKGYIIQTYYKGMPLNDYLAFYLPLLNNMQKNELAFRIGLAVTELHRKNIIHADLKPENMIIMFSSSDEEAPEIKLIDFGLSIKLRSGEASRETGFCGTPFYLPNDLYEEWKAYRKLGTAATERPVFELSKKIDVYALGRLFKEVIKVEANEEIFKGMAEYKSASAKTIAEVTSYFKKTDRQPLPAIDLNNNLIAKYKWAHFDYTPGKNSNLKNKKNYFLRELKSIVLQSNDIQQLRNLFEYLNASEKNQPFLTKNRLLPIGRRRLTFSWRNTLKLIKERALFLAEQELALAKSEEARGNAESITRINEDLYKPILKVNRSRFFCRKITSSEKQFEQLKNRYTVGR